MIFPHAAASPHVPVKAPLSPPIVISISRYNVVDQFERGTAGKDFVIRGIILGVSRYEDSNATDGKMILNVDILDRDGSDAVRIIFYDREAERFTDKLKEGHAIAIRNPTSRSVNDFREKPSLFKNFYLKFGDSTTCSVGNTEVTFDMAKARACYNEFNVREVLKLQTGRVIGKFKICQCAIYCIT